MAGAYQLHPQAGEREMAIFKHAMKEHVGMDFQPVAVASQVVNGVNYIFICSGSPVVPNPETKLYAVKIHAKFRPGIAPTVEIKSIGEVDVAGLVSE